MYMEKKIRKTDEPTIKNLTEYYRKVINKTMMDDPNEWEQRKKENKRQRRAEGVQNAFHKWEFAYDVLSMHFVRGSIVVLCKSGGNILIGTIDPRAASYQQSDMGTAIERS